MDTATFPDKFELLSEDSDYEQGEHLLSFLCASEEKTQIDLPKSTSQTEASLNGPNGYSLSLG